LRQCDDFTGLNDEEKKVLQLKRPRQMFTDVQDSLNTGTSPSIPAEDGVTLVNSRRESVFELAINLYKDGFVICMISTWLSDVNFIL